MTIRSLRVSQITHKTICYLGLVILLGLEVRCRSYPNETGSCRACLGQLGEKVVFKRYTFYSDPSERIYNTQFKTLNWSTTDSGNIFDYYYKNRRLITNDTFYFVSSLLISDNSSDSLINNTQLGSLSSDGDTIIQKSRKIVFLKEDSMSVKYRRVNYSIFRYRSTGDSSCIVFYCSPQFGLIKSYSNDFRVGTFEIEFHNQAVNQVVYRLRRSMVSHDDFLVTCGHEAYLNGFLIDK